MSATLCSGDESFSQDYAPTMEFVAIGTDSHVSILVGDHWISDGTVLSQLSEREQEFLANLVMRRRQLAGPNLSRESFERQLAQNPRALLTENSSTIRSGQ